MPALDTNSLVPGMDLTELLSVQAQILLWLKFIVRFKLINNVMSQRLGDFELPAVMHFFKYKVFKY